MSDDSLIRPDPWQMLRQHTRARIALGRVGSSLPTREVLKFGVAHALARDAVHLPLDTEALQERIEAVGFDVMQVASRAADRHTYLLRPDLGRRVAPDDVSRLRGATTAPGPDLLLVVGDGLSSLAVARQVPALLAELKANWPDGWRSGPVVVARQARVALADEVGEALGARMVAMLIGERPGLTAPDSLGVYLTWSPRVGCNDAQRNCISNIRPEGLSHAAAAHKLLWLAREAKRLQLTGVALKDESDVLEIGGDDAKMQIERP
jgi:ethanolamine ammonia-lyase small subunit